MLTVEDYLSKVDINSILYINRIPIDLFIPKEIPKLNPLTSAYKKFWVEETRKCIDGIWVEHKGDWKYVPGILYFYGAHWHILLSEGTLISKAKVIARPKIRDLEWINAFIYLEARGFSGFADDDEYTCHREVALPEEDRTPEFMGRGCYNSKGELKKYTPAREYLKRYFKRNMGKPLYENMAKNVVDLEARGGGKDLEENTIVFGEFGNFPIKDISIGDRIYGRDGKLTTVLDRMDYSDQMQYEVTLSDGRKIECGEGHLWTVRQRSKKYLYVTKTLGELKEDYLVGARKDSRYFVPICEPIQYPEQTLPIDPYFLGLWLGDGCSRTTGITTMDDEIVNYLQEYSDSLGMRLYRGKPTSKAAFYRIVNGLGAQNPILNSLRDLGVYMAKKIPEIYLRSSVEQRLALLQGLMDSDGYADGRHIEINTSYAGIQDTLPALLHSLGIRTKVRTKKTYRKDSLRISLLTDLPVFRLSRKLKYVGQNNSMYAKTNRKWSAIVDIRPTTVKPSVCIAVDNEDSLFLAGDHIVTHNSFKLSGFSGGNFTFDGAQDFDEYWAMKKTSNQLSSETLIGSIDSKYTNDLIKKIKLGLESFEGKFTLGNTTYVPPFSKAYSGQWNPGHTIIQEVEVKKGGQWEKKGSRSKIQPRTFGDNEFAANGTRPGFSVLDEIGFMSNLQEVLVQMKECTADSAVKFGTIWMAGTGGDMGGGSTVAVMSVFYDPATYDCLEFEDYYENSGNKIGMFIPAWMTLNQFKDELGNTNYRAALQYLLKSREKLTHGKDRSAYDGELSQRPIFPSEVFLISGGNMFPTGMLKDQLSFLETTPDPSYAGTIGRMSMAPDGTITFIPDLTGKTKNCDWPVKKGDNHTGGVMIFEQPTPNVGFGYYLAGNDPYDQDKAPNSVSLGSLLVMRRESPGISGYDMIVAEYTARPETARDYYEQCRLLLLYYNIIGTCLYENEKIGIKTYLENNNCLHLLAPTPSILKSNQTSNVNRGIGQHMSKTVKEEVEIFVRDWLIAPAGDGKLNLHRIYSKPLLKELINYNKLGNFDRYIALALCVIQKTQMHKIVVEEVAKEKVKDEFFSNFMKPRTYSNGTGFIGY